MFGLQTENKEKKTIKKFDTSKPLITIEYNKIKISCPDIDAFDLAVKSKNDFNNKRRESIIGAIINKKIPLNYYEYSLRWERLKNSVNKYIQTLCEEKEIKLETVKCEHKAGRNNHYDLLITINENVVFNVEFKFNASNLDDTPQFVSPMKPSQYLEQSYESYFYDNYLKILTNEFNLSLPDKDTYLKQIHSPSPECVSELQSKYYSGCKSSSKFTSQEDDVKFYERAKELSKESIVSFITEYGIKTDLLTNYLLETQKNKYYMLYKNGELHFQKINLDNYKIISCEKRPSAQSYIAETETGVKMKILLRWKNGNGIAYPAFQIS